DDDDPPVIEASKTATLLTDADGDGVPSPGDEIAYDVVVANTGGGTATAVALNDLIPAHTQILAGSVVTTAGTVDSEDPVQVSLGELLPGASEAVAFVVTVDAPIAAGVTEIANQGTVTSDQLPAVLTDDPALGGDTDPTVTAITSAPALAAEKTATLAIDADADGAASPGDTLAYTVTVRNTGNTSATGVALIDPIPFATTVVAGSVTATAGTVDGEDPVSVTLGEVAGGAVVTIEFQVTIDDPIAAGTAAISNQGTLISAELDDLSTDDPSLGGDADPTVLVISAAPVLAAEKPAPLFADHDGDGIASPG
ncbi:MAG: DUF11 domain-containing protein, partial [Arcobacter sp.]|nr:DUF11 domain-containing protein [Arcobacter sp.]